VLYGAAQSSQLTVTAVGCFVLCAIHTSQVFEEAIKAGLAHKQSGADFIDDALSLLES
jgi:hypothetical protein